ncbi:hypothetical protein GG344DRAFT_69631 [Lentinula edodes]|nr:hypothetical protein GG344DRAFT_69631 [Lentinula edodes]
MEPNCSLPPELLREIISFHISQNITLVDTKHVGSSKPSWQLFSSLSLASKILRTLALEAWFAILCVRRDEDLLDEFMPFPEIKTWTREIHFMQWTEDSSSWNFEGFTRLKKIRIDCSKTDIVPPKFPSGLVISNDIELEIRNLYWPSPLVAQCISRIFPKLKVLRLRQARTWCGLCHTCCIPEFRSPVPKSIRYEDGMGLPVHYALAFSSLEYLETIHIMVGVLESGKTTLGSGKGQNPNLWSGECDRCMEIMYEDETFKREWVAKKQNVTVKPPMLSTVEWSFLPKEEFESSVLSDDDDEEEDI